MLFFRFSVKTAFSNFASPCGRDSGLAFLRSEVTCFNVIPRLRSARPCGMATEYRSFVPSALQEIPRISNVSQRHKTSDLIFMCQKLHSKLIATFRQTTFCREYDNSPLLRYDEAQ